MSGDTGSMHAVSRSRTVTSLAFRPPPRPSRLFLTPVAALVFLPLASLFPPSLAQASAPPAGIIAADGGRFVDPSDGSTFTVVGANCYYLAYSSGAEEGSYEHTWVTQVLDEAESLGLNVIRVWAFQDQWWEGERALQPGPEVYNERFLVALDGLLAQASSRGLRLLLCMTNYWEDYGGAIAYIKWAHQAGERGPEGRLLHRREDFFTSDLCRGWFKALATKLATRINTITGVAYKDDPTIFAWELCNEPRYQGDSSGDVLQAWTEEMAAHVKSVDPNHMLTVGSEGFYGAASPSRAGDNPISGAAKMGVDFARNFAVRELDFACVHIWADLWLYTGESDKLEFLDRWITGHLEEARDTFDKPVILEEFGKWRPLGVRDVFFERAFAGAVAGPASNVPSHAAGALFWHADPDGYPHDEDGFSVRLPSDSGTAQVVATAADSIRGSPGVGGEGARARRSERARTRYRSPSSTRTPSEDAPAAPRYRFPRFRPVSAAGAAEGPNAPRDVAKEEHER